MFCIKTPARWHAFVFLGASLWPAPDLLAEPLTAMSEAPVCELPTTLTSEALVSLALNCSASQQAISARWQAQQHQVDVAGSLDDPKFMIGAAPQTFNDDRLDDGYILEFSQPLPWPGILSLREKVAAAEADVWQARYSQEQVILARDVRLRFAQWQYHRQLLAINKRHQRLWEEFIAIVRAKYASGTASKSAMLQATHEHHLLLQEAIEAAAEIDRDSSRLKRLINLPPYAQLESNAASRAALPALPANAVASLLSLLDQQPAMRGLDARTRRKTQELALAEKDRYPTFSVMTRYNSLWMNDEQRWVVGVGFNLPLDFGKRSSLEGRLRAEQSALRWEQQDLRVQLREQLVQAHSYWQQALEVRQLYRNDLMPLAEENLITARDEYQSGAGDFLSLLIAQRQLLNTQRKSEMTTRDQFARFAHLTAAAGMVKTSEWDRVGNSHE